MDSDKHKERQRAKIRQIRTSKILIFIAAFLSMLFSIYLFHSGDTQNGIFVGIWVPSILSAGALMMVGYDG